VVETYVHYEKQCRNLRYTPAKGKLCKLHGIPALGLLRTEIKTLEPMVAVRRSSPSLGKSDDWVKDD